MSAEQEPGSAPRRLPRNPIQEPERILISRCKQGDKNAYDDLIRLYEKRVYNYAFRLCGRYDEANDLASETFLRVYNSLANFRGDSSFITWLFRITTNVYLDEKKRQRARPSDSLDEMLELDESV